MMEKDNFYLNKERFSQSKEDVSFMPSISFVIPTYNHPLSSSLSEISYLFNSSRHNIIVVDDGSWKEILPEKKKDLVLITHDKNLGLARSLVDGYKKALESDTEFIIRMDGDGEYPLSSIPRALKIFEDKGISGVFIEYKRTFKSNGLLDASLHTIMGFLEGKILLGQPMHQHSPGLQIFRKEVLEKIYSFLEDYVAKNNIRWGLDLVTIKMASSIGKVVPVTLVSNDWKERRPIKKMVDQVISTTQIMFDNEVNNL